jgi:hypothetical protein
MTTGRLFALVIGPLLLAAAGPSRAQTIPSQPERGTYVLAISGVSSGAAATPLTGKPPASEEQVGSPNSAPASTAADEVGWHLVVSPYLWFPGVHGTVGVGGRDASVHASPGDLLSHFRFGLMGTLEARYKRLVLPVDIVWVRLGDEKALPGPNLGATTANVKVKEFILTPKIGFRILNQEKLKIDALTGFRYWHLGQNLEFSPSILGLNISGSQNWVDPLVGGRIEAAPIESRGQYFGRRRRLGCWFTTGLSGGRHSRLSDKTEMDAAGGLSVSGRELSQRKLNFGHRHCRCPVWREHSPQVNAIDTEWQAKNEGDGWSALMYSTIGGISDSGP